MTTKLLDIIIFIIVLSVINPSYGQTNKTSNFLKQIKSYDLSTIFSADSNLNKKRQNGNERINGIESIGFIGKNYQRFYIHFISVKKNSKNPYEYIVYGKTKVKENINIFRGKITIIKSSLYLGEEFPSIKVGFVICHVKLFEDKKFNNSGIIEGNLKTKFLITKKEEIKYDTLYEYADGFCNNQFIGRLTDYINKKSKKCNWGEYRIPECGDLDIGAGEFGLNEKYLKNGWETYNIANSYDDTNLINKSKALQIENQKWWK